MYLLEPLGSLAVTEMQVAANLHCANRDGGLVTYGAG